MKSILLLLSISLWIVADTTVMSYKSFKQKALESTNIIKQAKLSIEYAQKSSEMSLNIANPSTLLGINKYDNGNGWQLGVVQPLRLPGFGSDLKDVNIAKQELVKATFLQTKALFYKNLESYYTVFVFQKKAELLLQKELELAKRIKEIALNRLENGVGTKAGHMRADIEIQSIQNRLLSQKQNTAGYYFSLLTLANITKQVSLESNFIYAVQANLKSDDFLNPDLNRAQKEQAHLSKNIELSSHGIKSFDLSAEYEKDPISSQLSVAISVDLPIFTTSKQQTQLAKIRASQSSYEVEQLKTKQKLQTTALQSSLHSLKAQYNALQIQQTRQEELLKLYEEGYQISKGSLLELIEIKNRLLQTSKNLLDIQKDLNLKWIELNYIRGDYNE